MQTIAHVSRSAELQVDMAHALIGKTKPPAIPCITPCVSMKCHSFVLKAVPSIVRTQRTQPMPMIGLYWLRDPSMSGDVRKTDDDDLLAICEFPCYN